MLFDTTFVIHLEREYRQGQLGSAHAFLKIHPEAHLNISIITLAEFAEGYQFWEDTFAGMH